MSTVNPTPPLAQPPSSGPADGEPSAGQAAGPPGTSEPAGLTIGDLARRTGVTTATLRMWETRHGFPVAERLPSGHRRYRERDVERVRQVVRRRDAGVRLEWAIAEVTSGPEVTAPSVFATLRDRHPHLATYRLRKGTLLALSWALEDECVARAQRPWLFGAFQYERYYRQAERRWVDLARTARGAWVYADFRGPSGHADGPAEVALPGDSPMLREWSLVCATRDYPACLAAWELPGQVGGPEGDRVFEAMWTLDPAAVRDAALSCVHVAADLGHEVEEVRADLEAGPLSTGTELDQATALFNRVVAYVDGSLR